MVKNLHGTSKPRFKITRLSGKYVAAAGYDVKYCQHLGCDKPPVATAHVKLDDPSAPRTWFLVKLCASHNHYKYDEPIPLRSNARLIPVRDVSDK